MADPDQRSQEDGREPTSSDDATLSARLKSLDARLGQATRQRDEAAKPRSNSSSTSGALGQAYRLSAEFIAGVVAGGLLGWLVDRLFGTSPWGLIICIILGFCAGMLNLMRAAGLAKPARSDDEPKG